MTIRLPLVDPISLRLAKKTLKRILSMEVGQCMGEILMFSLSFVLIKGETVMGKLFNCKRFRRRLPQSCKCAELAEFLPPLVFTSEGHLCTTSFGLATALSLPPTNTPPYLCNIDTTPLLLHNKTELLPPASAYKQLFSSLHRVCVWARFPKQTERVFSRLYRSYLHIRSQDTILLSQSVKALQRFHTNLVYGQVDKQTTTGFHTCATFYLCNSSLKKHFEQVDPNSCISLPPSLLHMYPQPLGRKKLSSHQPPYSFYLLLKWKGFSGFSYLPCNKVRPLVSQKKCLFRKFLQTVGDALCAMLNTIRQSTTHIIWDLTNVSDCLAVFKIVQRPSSQFVECDLDDAFTNLHKGHCVNSVIWLWHTLFGNRDFCIVYTSDTTPTGKPVVCLSQRSHLFVGTSGTGTKIQKQFLLQAVQWELNSNNLFQFGGNVYRQTRGVCMGSYLSAYLQICTALYLEQRWLQFGFQPLTVKSLQHPQSNSLAPLVSRFRDNIYFVVDSTIPTETLLWMVQQIYCCPAKVEGENSNSHPLTTQVVFNMTRGQFTSIQPAKFPLHPSGIRFYSYTPPQLYLKDSFVGFGWLIGCLHRFREYCLSEHDFTQTYVIHIINCLNSHVPRSLLLAAHKYFFD